MDSIYGFTTRRAHGRAAWGRLCELSRMTDEVRAAFDRFDHDGDGSIAVKDFGAALRRLPRFADWSECKVQEQVAELDADGTSTVDYAEFCTVARRGCWDSWMMDTAENQLRHRCERLFRSLERRNGGQLSVHDCRQAMMLPCARCGCDALECPSWLASEDADILGSPASYTGWVQSALLGTLEEAALEEALAGGAVDENAAISTLIHEHVEAILRKVTGSDGRVSPNALLESLFGAQDS